MFLYSPLRHTKSFESYFMYLFTFSRLTSWTRPAKRTTLPSGTTTSGAGKDSSAFSASQTVTAFRFDDQKYNLSLEHSDWLKN